MEQQPVKRILDAFEETNIVLLTGPGGTGKTHTINQLGDHFDSIARTATTGIAATHIGGETIHQFAGLKTYFSLDALSKITNGHGWPWISRNINAVDLTVIDEVSMLHKNQFELLDKIFDHASWSGKFNAKAESEGVPFGGKKILLSGDFLQLPPVNKDSKVDPWIFNTEVWKKANPKVIELTKIWRQTDREFTETLMRIRNGECQHNDEALIRDCTDQDFGDVNPVKFVATNREADAINLAEIQKLDTEEFTSDAIVKVYEYSSEKQKEFVARQIAKDAIAPARLWLKVGCQVMILKNGDGYYNGSMGEVVGFAKDDSGNKGVRVKLYANDRVIFIGRDEWEKVNNFGNVVAAYSQIPLKPAYAITIHKSQGMTLDYCDIDFSRFFAPGQAYVALSRVKSLSGLRVRNWSKQKVFADRKALEFYKRTRG